MVEDPQDSGPQIDPSLFTFDLIGEKVSLINNGVTITAIDNNNQLSKLDDDDQIRVELSGVGNVTKKVFTKSDFNNKAIKIVVNSPTAGIANIMSRQKQSSGQLYRKSRQRCKPAYRNRRIFPEKHHWRP